MSVYAYSRVSAKDQNEERQVNEFLAMEIPRQNIFIEKISGKTFNRKTYGRLLKLLKAGDTLYIESIDRLGRDYDGILEQWNKLSKKKKIIIRVLNTPILNTDNPFDSLTDKFIKDVTLLSLAFNAEQEWQNIKHRQSQGIANAKAKGKHLGRPKAPISYRENDFAIIEQWKNRTISEADAMKLLRKGRTSFYKLVRIYEQIKKDGD